MGERGLDLHIDLTHLPIFRRRLYPEPVIAEVDHLDREVFEGGIAHEDGAITLQLGGVEFVIARRE